MTEDLTSRASNCYATRSGGTTLHRHIFALLSVTALVLGLAAGTGSAQEEPPTTGFEESDGGAWTTFDEEVAFLEAVADRSPRATLDTIGETLEGRPLHLVQVGEPEPVTADAARQRPTVLFVCTQHGNEPAGREACLITLRDLAFADDPAAVELLRSTTVIFIPTANPDGREANTRGNADGTDVNRDHLNLETPEAQAIAAVARDWQPDMILDMHEYGPSVPVFYDDDVLYLWPRNLNVDADIHGLARSFAEDHLHGCIEDGGYSADEYGVFEAGDVNLYQSAGGADEGIARNTSGLRHSLGILIESAVTQRPGTEVIDSAENRRRRVDSQLRVTDCTFDWLTEQSDHVDATTAAVRDRQAAVGAEQAEPIYFDGQYDDTALAGSDAEPTTVADPPPCAYDLTSDQLRQVAETLDLHGVSRQNLDQGGVRAHMGQTARPVIALLLDERGQRHAVAGTPVEDCDRGEDSPQGRNGGGGQDDGGDAAGATLPTTGGGAAGLAVLVAVGLAMVLSGRR